MPVIALPPYRKLQDYVDVIRLLGGEPRLLDLRRDTPAEVVAAVDGVILPGGGDVDPSRYGEPRHPTFDPPEEGRDPFELELAVRADAVDLPLLAICRGIQVLNVARGGSLVQDIPSQAASAGSHMVREPSNALAHQIRVVPGTRLARLLGEPGEAGSCQVNSRHHQSVKSLGSGLVITATAPDGIVEAVEDPERRFCVGVQWHPENFYRTGEFNGLFRGLLQACEKK